MADELIRALLADGPAAVVGHIASVRGSGQSPVEEDAERDRRSPRRRPRDEVDIPGVELERDPSAGRARHGGMRRDRPGPSQCPGVERQPPGRRVGGRLVERRDLGLREAGALPVADVRLRRPQGPPVGGDLEPDWLDIHQVLVDVHAPAVAQQLLDGHLGHLVLALTEMVEADPPVPIGEVQRRPEVVVQGTPDPVVAVDRDRVLDAEGARLGDDVVAVALEAELGRMDADDGEADVRVSRRPCPDVRQRPEPVDTGVGPDVDEDDAAAQSLGCQRLRVEPAGRAGERRQVTFDREVGRVAGQAVGDRADQAGLSLFGLGHQSAVRRDRNAARSSWVKSSGSCHAAKWLPRSSSLK